MSEIGPECPKCGCNATFLFETLLGGVRRFQCDHCQHVQSVGSNNGRGVPFVPVRCPECGGKRCPVTSSGPFRASNRVRYHKCQDCDHAFKSVER